MPNTHRIDLCDLDARKWVEVSKAPSLAVAEHRVDRMGCTARVVDIATGTTTTAWKQGKRVALK